jgi:hypothetical protein
MTEKENIKQGNINDLISVINKANDTFAYSVFVPSLNKEILFREINTAQQKKLVKSIIDSPIFNTEFIFTLREIIKENCVDTSVNVDELSIYDKLIISLYMRIYSIGTELTVNSKCPECDKLHSRIIKLNELLESVKDSISIKFSDIIEDETKTFKIYCEIPKISTEYNLEKEFRKNTKIDVKDEKDLRETLGNVFISELVKFISKIEITNKQEGKIIELNLETMKFSDRVQLIEKLNVKLLRSIVEYISSIKKEFDKIFLSKITCDCENKTEIEQRFSIDSNFFIIS